MGAGISGLTDTESSASIGSGKLCTISRRLVDIGAYSNSFRGYTGSGYVSYSTKLLDSI